MKKEFKMNGLGVLMLIIFGAWVLFVITRLMNDESPWMGVVFGFVSLLTAASNIRVVDVSKPVGALFFFKGETPNHVTVGLDLTANPIDVLGLKEATIEIVDMRNEQQSASVPHS